MVMLPECKHSPHRDQPQRTLDCMVKFVAGLGRQQVFAQGATD